MKILALSARRYLGVTQKLVGGDGYVLSFPPLYSGDLAAQVWQGYDLIYLDLHGAEGSGYLYNDQRLLQPAIKVDEIAGLDFGLPRPVVFSIACFFAESSFPAAFIQAGAQAVIGGAGLNFAGRSRIGAAQLLARNFILKMKAGEDDPGRALQAAKDRVRLDPRLWLNPKARADTLSFEVLEQT